jgi:hypothetical protein
MGDGDLDQGLTLLDERHPLFAHQRSELAIRALAGLGRVRGAEQRGGEKRTERARRAAVPRALLLLAGLACARTPLDALPAPAPALPDAEPQRVVVEVPPPPCERIERIEVRKSLRQLFALCEGGATVILRVAVGKEPRGTKERAGDLRTPEGQYQVAGEREPSRFHGFIPLDYPSDQDAVRAHAAGTLTERDHDRIIAAHERGKLPPWDTPLGGEIGIHGEGERWSGTSENVDWTYGCLAVRDEDLDFLSERLRPGVPVLILP